jgi:hypothetical protein
MKTSRILRPAVSLVILFILLAFCSSSAWCQATTGRAESKNAPAPGAKWQSYVSKKYGFRFLYPPGSTVEERDDTNYKYVRVQNYECSDEKGLKPTEFYLEVFIFDPSLGHQEWEPCEKAIKNPKRSRQGNVVIYTGSEDDPPGDPGGFREVLCAQLLGLQILVDGTEGTQETPIVKAILKSFEFAK